MQSKYGKGSLVISVVIGLVLGLCAGIIFFNLLTQGAVTLYLQFGWNPLVIFFAAFFSMVGGGAGWAIWHSRSRSNGSGDLPPGVSVAVILVLGIVVFFLLMVLRVFLGLFSGR